MRKTDEDKKRSQVIKSRFTPAEARIVKANANQYALSLSDYLRAPDLAEPGLAGRFLVNLRSSCLGQVPHTMRRSSQDGTIHPSARSVRAK